MDESVKYGFIMDKELLLRHVANVPTSKQIIFDTFVFFFSFNISCRGSILFFNISVNTCAPLFMAN